jgi:hypothetical protein
MKTREGCSNGHPSRRTGATRSRIMNAIDRFIPPHRTILRARMRHCIVLVALLWVAQPVLGDNDRGFLHGRITTEGGSTYEGRIRWGDEEAFWGDFFNASKTERTYPDEMPDGARRKEPIKIFGITLRWGSDSDSSRVFKARFGDIKEIRVRSGDSAIVVMKNGSEYRIGGGSNDLGGKIQVWDASIGKVELDWDRIDKIEFLATPKSVEVEERRLYGTVQTSSGEFRGYVQWDQDECLSIDKLDGDSSDANLSIEMGNIRSIERRSRSSSRVVLMDDREFVLDGSNDVDSDNRGIFVDDPRFGRVLVSWDAFQRIDFSDPGDSGPTYDEFKPARSLHATVTDRRGNTHSGRIVYDLDESETWEFLDGKSKDIDYVIPMGMVASIVPQGRDSSLVILSNGEEVELEDTADASESNDGILVLMNGGKQTYLAWGEVRRIDFDR